MKSDVQAIEDQTDHIAVDNIYRKINNADGVIIATQNTAIQRTANKNIIEHLSVSKRPSRTKRSSYWGLLRTRFGLRSLDLNKFRSTWRNAYTMLGNEFLLSRPKHLTKQPFERRINYSFSFCLGEFKAYVGWSQS